MKERLASVVALLLLAALCAISYWYSVKATLESVPHLSNIEAPDFTATGVAMTKFDTQGKAKSKIFASEIEHYSDGSAKAKNPEYFSLNPTEPQITARADRASMEEGGAIVHFYDNVDIRQAADGDKPASRMETSRLDAYPDTDTYRSDEEVKLTRGGDISFGKGMDFDNVERTFKLRSQVRTVLQPKAAEKKAP